MLEKVCIFTASLYFLLSISIKNPFFSDIFLHILWIEAILICPITYKILNRIVEKRHKSLTNITSAEGILLRMNRSIQVEGAFGVMKEDHGFRLFLTRGKNNVKIEFTLLSFGYNINKLHNKIQNDRCGLFLHHKEIA